MLGIACFIAAIKLLPKDKPNQNEQLDLVGSILLGGGMLFMFYGFIQGPTDGWTNVSISSVLVGLIVLVGFGFRQVLAANPLIKPSLFKNRGFNSGLIMGLVFFASVNGFSYVISLFMQLVLGMSPSESALGMIPLLLGIIVSSTVGRPLIEKWGRKLVLVGLIVTFAGAITLELTIFAMAGHINALAMAPALMILGIGMGACFGSIFDVALGNVAPEESGSASGALSAAQQVANALGGALVTSIYFTELGARGGASALQLTVAVVAGLIVLCLILVPLLPPKAAHEPD
jgi:predicted MFS family arabinose efflux permease